ncbi:hypothetical protein BFR45_08230 [Brochothrix thermosphacta]|uniref:Crp/Fnr family transcriptional regulator n=3 Tax=Brochothrix thermosphacta TaxID=2756 RepID=A0A1D2L2V5_BROTH|nr:Crp/Fnr family transcriptional regulator [Brochothrix thermosphacta]ATH84858.1 Crp/Fnr family transcriptional regulator [Brochothrix thermosphacta]MPQ28179.1 cyclic nucleotide-binding domain-containing protein [Brochothrix thermosphacta]ODJ64207.1 hypothetical protein BFR36_03130 [Brochothrix thermosphacta]ODJ71938.1 hypothetical protein BFR39_04140 [Brochothrix thermosphacta]
MIKCYQLRGGVDLERVMNREQVDYYIQKYGLDQHINEELRSFMTIQTYQSGELICTQGEEIEHVLFQVEGRMKIFTTSSEGKNLIVAIKEPFEILGDVECIQDVSCMNTIEAISTVKMLAISKKVIHQNGFQDARFLQLLLNVVSEKFWLKSEALSINLLYPVEVRFASYLTSIVCDEQNCALNRSELKDTADLIGTSSRHLNRIIKAFIEDGMIERTETDIIIKNREKLIAIAKDIYN